MDGPNNQATYAQYHDPKATVQRVNSLPSAEYLKQLIGGLGKFRAGLPKSRGEIRWANYDDSSRAFKPTVINFQSPDSTAEVFIGRLTVEDFLVFRGLGIEATLSDYGRKTGPDSLAFLMVRPEALRRYKSTHSASVDTTCGLPFDKSQLIEGKVAVTELPQASQSALNDLFKDYMESTRPLYDRKFQQNPLFSMPPQYVPPRRLHGRGPRTGKK